MDALKFLLEKQRICLSMRTDCEGCPVHRYCKISILELRAANESFFRDMIGIVEKWSAEHPGPDWIREITDIFSASSEEPDESIKEKRDYIRRLEGRAEALSKALGVAGPQRLMPEVAKGYLEGYGDGLEYFIEMKYGGAAVKAVRELIGKDDGS